MKAKGKSGDLTIRGCMAYFMPVHTRMPLKFGHETLTYVTCLRVALDAENAAGSKAKGWGETPLSVQWVWPSDLSYEERHAALKDFSLVLARAWAGVTRTGDPFELGHDFQEQELPGLLSDFNAAGPAANPCPGWLPWSAAPHSTSPSMTRSRRRSGCRSIDTYTEQYLNRDLSSYLTPEDGSGVSFQNRYPADFLVRSAPQLLPAWHLVGGKDPIAASDLSGTEPKDGYPVLLSDWIASDGLKCLKVKLRGNDETWDFQRLVDVGLIGAEAGVHWLSTDFNCTVQEPSYVNRILDRLMLEHPRIYGMILYVEQPFPYDLEKHQIEVRSVSARKPLFMDESAHDWKLIRLGRRLGWTGVALKTCKTQTGAILSACWAKAHGMTLMVQDLTNPMLAQVPHVLLAANVGTIMGVETNAMQFYPEASRAEARVHPGIYVRRDGTIDLGTLSGPGFGYRVDRMERELPQPAVRIGAVE